MTTTDVNTATNSHPEIVTRGLNVMQNVQQTIDLSAVNPLTTKCTTLETGTAKP